MKAIIPTQDIEQTGVQFPISGELASKICAVITMELFGASKAEVARQSKESKAQAQKIMEIIGLDADQFTQIAMIAQHLRAPYCKKMQDRPLDASNQQTYQPFRHVQYP